MVDPTNSGEQCASNASIQKYAIGTITCGRYLPELNLGKDRKKRIGIELLLVQVLKFWG